MNCDRLKEMLIDYIEGALAGKQKAEFEAHLQECPECRELIKSFGKLSVSVKDHLDRKASTADLPPMLWAKILAAVQSQKKAARSRGFFKVALTFASVLVVVTAGIFTPVFGKEGNLLNFISAKVIDSAASELADLFTPDFKGQILKAYALNSISSGNGMTDAQIWKMKSIGFSPKDIAVAVFVSTNSGRALDDIILERVSGTGWGKIANQSGISVFSVRQALANPIENVATNVAKAEKFELPVTVSDVDNNRILVDSFTEPVELDGIVPVDQNNSPIELASLDPSDFTMSFAFKDGRLELQNLRLENPKAPDKSKFNLEGKVVSYDGSKIVVETTDGSREIVTVAGETSMHALAAPGEEIRISGYLIDAKLTASAVTRGRARRHMAGRKAKPEEKVERIETPRGSGKPQNRGQVKGQPTAKVDQPKAKPEEKPVVQPKDAPTPKPVAKSFSIDTGFVAFDRATSQLTTGSGTYVVGNTTVGISTGIDTKPIGLGILGILSPDTKISIWGEGNKVSTVIIDKSAFTEVSGWIARTSGNSVIMVSKADGIFRKIDLAIPDWAAIEPSKDAIKPGSRISIALVGNGAVVYAKIEPAKFKIYRGKVNRYTFDSIVVSGQEIAIASITDFISEGGAPDPKDIKPGMPVAVHATVIDNQLVAIQIIKGPPPPMPDEKPLRVRSISRKGEGRIELTLEDGRSIAVSLKGTRILKDVNGERTEADAGLIKEGIYILFRMNRDATVAAEVVIVKPQP